MPASPVVDGEYDEKPEYQQREESTDDNQEVEKMIHLACVQRSVDRKEWNPTMLHQILPARASRRNMTNMKPKRISAVAAPKSLTVRITRSPYLPVAGSYR